MAKKRVRLYDHEAQALGFDLRKHEKGRSTARYTLNVEHLATIEAIRNNNTSTSATSGYETKQIFSAVREGRMMDIDTYCLHYNLPREDITSYKLVSHTGIPYYNIVFKEKVFFDEFDYIGELEKHIVSLSKRKHNYVLSAKGEGVITLTDLHFAAYVESLKIAPDFNISVLCEMLEYAAVRANEMNYSVLHVHLLGDLIESFTGLNHKNSWKQMIQGMFGVKVVKSFVTVFKEHFLDRVNNLGSIKLVAGNHDRVTSDNKEDVNGGAAELIAWGLKMLGYDISFSASVLTHRVNDINYILNHSHLGLSVLSTEEICWKYGEKGIYNFVTEGHLHSRISKLSAKQISNFKTMIDDTIDCRRMICPSLFTGNTYSEHKGWSTSPGFIITEQSRRGTIDLYDISC